MLRIIIWCLPLLTLLSFSCTPTPSNTNAPSSVLNEVEEDKEEEEEEENNNTASDAGEVIDVGDPPDCPALSEAEVFPVPGPDGGMVYPDPEIRLPATCGTRASSVTAECGSPAAATLTIGDDSYDLKWACNGPYELMDNQAAHNYLGFHVTLVPDDGCYPMVTLVIQGHLTLAPGPVEAWELACTTGELYALAFVVAMSEEDCRVITEPPDGQFEMLRMSPTLGVAGTLNTFIMNNAGVSLPATLDFELSPNAATRILNSERHGFCPQE